MRIDVYSTAEMEFRSHQYAPERSFPIHNSPVYKGERFDPQETGGGRVAGLLVDLHNMVRDFITLDRLFTAVYIQRQIEERIPYGFVGRLAISFDGVDISYASLVTPDQQLIHTKETIVVEVIGAGDGDLIPTEFTFVDQNGKFLAVVRRESFTQLPRTAVVEEQCLLPGRIDARPGRPFIHRDRPTFIDRNPDLTRQQRDFLDFGKRYA